MLVKNTVYSLLCNLSLYSEFYFVISHCIHNLYFVNVDSEEKLHDMVDLIDLFFSRGGHHVQVNCQDKAVFIDAQRHPEKYVGLMVRVAGYVAYFVELPKSIQDQIIHRTSHHV